MKVKRPHIRKPKHESEKKGGMHISMRHKTRRYYTVLGLRVAGNFLILFSMIWLFIVFSPFITSEARYRVDKIRNRSYSLDKPQGETFAGLLRKAPPLLIDPINTTNSIVVEKIDANEPIVFDVDAGNESIYDEALKQGVAHAQGTVKPGETGNSYLFAHSAGDPWTAARYNAVFYLLRELENGDRVVVFRDNWRYDFRVYDKKVVEPTDVQFFVAEYPEPVLTLQTCWPPATLVKRMLVFAKLENKYKLDGASNPLVGSVLEDLLAKK